MNKRGFIRNMNIWWNLSVRKKLSWKTSVKSHQEFNNAFGLKRFSRSQIEEELRLSGSTKAEIHQRCDQYKVEWDALQGQLQNAFKRQQELREWNLQKLDAQQHSSKFYNESARNLSESAYRSYSGNDDGLYSNRSAGMKRQWKIFLQTN